MRQLRTARLDGVPFVFVSGTASFGRRIVSREFPNRDIPGDEDIGKGRREFKIVGFVVGEDWQRQRDRLIAAAERKGPRRLTHPTFGELEVRVPRKGLQIGEDSEALRMVSFTLTVLEAGRLAFPTARPSDTGPSYSAAAAMNDTAAEVFLERFDTALGGYVVPDAVEDTLDALDLIVAAVEAPLAVMDRASEILDTVADFRARVDDYIAAPGELADAAQALIAKFEDLAGLDAFATSFEVNPPTVPGLGATPAERASSTNARALEDLFRHTALGALAVEAAEREFDSFDAAVEARDRYATRITTAADVAHVGGRPHEALADLRTALAVNITARAVNLPRLKTYTPALVDVSFVLAQELYGDASRAREIEDRNGTHAVIGEPVRVLNA